MACAHVCRAPLAKQERALTAWLNLHLAEQLQGAGADAAGVAGGAQLVLTQQRLAAQVGVRDGRECIGGGAKRGSRSS